MAVIDTEDKLIAYVRRQLGEPLITVEVSDDMIRDHIYNTIQKYTEFAYDGLTRDTFGFDTIPNVYDYYLDDRIRDVIVVKGMSYTGVATVTIPNNEMIIYNNFYSVFTNPGSSTGITSFTINLAQQSLVDTIFDKDVNWKFNPESKMLRFLEPPQSRYVIECEIEYEPKAVDRIYNHEWIKKMVISKTKFSWGTVTGKYDQTLVSGARINYQDMKSEAQQEIEKLDEELMTRYLEPAPIYVG